MKRLIFLFCLILSFSLCSDARGKVRYSTPEGLVLAGYQGWFNTPDDGAGLGWKHYRKDGEFRPGMCSIDLWPDVTEYQKTYPTSFVHADGRAAHVFSSHDNCVTDTHFRWMYEYGIDGVFMQRFVTSISSEKGQANYTDILFNALDAAEKYDRAICVMYDLSGMNKDQVKTLKDDWKKLVKKGLLSRKDNHYLHCNGKPLVAVWGAGFNDGRKYGYDEIEDIIDFFKGQGCSILLGVPARWRTLTMDTIEDKRLHEIIEKIDVVHPWYVGRFNYSSYDGFASVVEEDARWCEEHGKIFMPVLFPGFSWYNLKGGVAAPLNQIPRMGGEFFWKQVCNSVKVGAKTLYLAMFDEIDEGTAFFKCTNDVPVGDSPFLSYEGCEPDRYLWLAGQAAKVLRGEAPTGPMPKRTSAEEKTPVDYVNPYMGNISHLLVPTYPTVHLPNSMLRVYPERADYTGDLIKGLPLLVTSHRGKSVFNLSCGTGSPEGNRPYYMYHYDNEKITPYSYSVYLEDEEVQVDFSLSCHSAMYSLKFEKSGQPYVILSSNNGDIGFDGNAVEGWQSIEGDTKAYIHAEFSVPASRVESYKKDNGNWVVLYFPENVSQIYMKYGVSFIDERQAESNLRSEICDFDLDRLSGAGRDIWNSRLSKIKVSATDEDDLIVFYTSLYRTYERMICISEGNRYYSAFDGKVHEDDRPFYTDDWIWDTYRAVHPLRVLIEPEMESDMIDSYLRMSEQMSPSWMPTFPEVTGDSRRMNSNHGVATVVDAVAKGLSDFDLEKAYEYCKAGITEKSLAPWSGVKAGGLTQFYWKKGYIPALREDEKEIYSEVHHFERRQPVAVTLGTSYDEWCLSRLASSVGNERDSAYFAQGSLKYRNIFNHETGFFHPKDEAGNFIEPFDYVRSGGMGARGFYGENNGWVYRWDVPHNIADLIDLMGGNDRFVSELDRMFSAPLGSSKYEFYSQLPDHTGNVGQFSMANEPSLHVPYLYNYAGCPWKTQKRIRSLLRQWFRNDLMGVPGDEDGGGMSAFVVFSMMGFYPVTPGLPVYVIGSPVVDCGEVDLGDGKTFKVVARNNSPENKYILSARLNGVPLHRCWFTHEELMAGGTLEFEMGNKPNKNWGVEQVPPSFEIE